MPTKTRPTLKMKTSMGPATRIKPDAGLESMPKPAVSEVVTVASLICVNRNSIELSCACCRILGPFLRNVEGRGRSSGQFEG